MGNSSRKILLIDDEINIINVVRAYLENSNYIVYVAYNGQQALESFEKNNPSLIILDLMLPDIQGEEICITLRKKSRIPIIILTAKVKENEILNGFEIGADDYITKPFSPRQLVARVGTLFRRMEENYRLPSDIISVNENELVIDNSKHEVRKNGNIVKLTPGEYKILLMLVQNPGKVFSREELIKHAFGREYREYDRIIDTHVKNIRHKIESNIMMPKLIKTIYAGGYKFTGEVK